MTAVTRDSISLRGAGVVSVFQPDKGARFTLDSLLLADFCRIKPHERVLEPGAGSGIISLLLAQKHPRSSIVAVEVQPAAAKLCRENITANGLDEHITLLEQDIMKLKKILKPATFDAIVANPPYTRTGAGKQSPLLERLHARHDRLGDLAAWLNLHLFLKNKGRFVVVFPCDRLAELITGLRVRRLEPKRMRLVHPYRDRPSSLILIEAVKSAGAGLEVMPPLVVHETNGRYTEEMCRIYDLP